MRKVRIFSESGQSASLLRRRYGMPGFGAAKAAAGQACGALELNFPAAPTCFFPGLHRILALRRILAKPQQNPPQKSRHTSPAKSSLQNLHLLLQNFAPFLPFFLCIFSAFHAFLRKDLSFGKFHPFLCQNRSPSPCYTEHSSEESPAGAPSDETSPAKIQVITTYRKQEVTHELLR